MFYNAKNFGAFIMRTVLTGVLLFLSLTSCRDLLAPYDEVVVLDGRIDGQLLTRLKSQTTSKTNLVRIRSLGGDVSAGLEMAEFILEKRLRVEAFDYCLSACLMYVWMAGAKRQIAPDTLLAFHGGQMSHLDLYTEYRGVEPNLRPPQSLIYTAQREDALYRRIGVDPNILFAASYIRNLQCALLVERAEDGFRSLLPVWEATGTLPTMGFLQSYGVSVDQGSLPEKQSELDQIVTKLGDPELPFFILTLTVDEGLTREQIKLKMPYERLKRCDPNDPEFDNVREQVDKLDI